MKILVVGATGATGQLLVKQLLERGHDVKVIVRSTGKFPEEIRTHKNIFIIKAAILDMSNTDMAQHSRGCDAIACCLGHTMSFHGIFGSPRRLVTDSVRRLCHALQANNPPKPVKFVLMNSAGCSNQDIPEDVSFAQCCVIAVLRLLLPPHVDNEQAADYFRIEIGQNHPAIEWSVVRPDNLIDENTISPYKVHISPIRSAIFDPGKTSRINVAHFMADLMSDPAIWSVWKEQMPVIYNQLTHNKN
ncbi:MAG: hypothetical protein DHS20C13_00650 [Thermodesulfobacteriota bacterium]|nr:MAG: hypothetical protein DHS20C13_00650 [Thermodesulfobacteriota bacterium]